MKNIVINKDEYYISYNSNLRKPETALVVKGEDGERKFYILYGNHMTEYNELASLAECMDYYQNNKNQQSIWSDDYIEDDAKPEDVIKLGIQMLEELYKERGGGDESSITSDKLN